MEELTATGNNRVLQEILHPEQGYVLEAQASLGIDIRVALHESETDTCFEKAEILGWPAERVVKAVFLSRGSELYGFIFPEIGTEESPAYINAREIIKALLGYGNGKAKEFHNDYCPEGMEKGTCTPFVLERTFENPDKRLARLFIHRKPELDDKVVDISIGGAGEEAHRLSLHMQYRAIYDILEYRFGDKVSRADLMLTNNT